MPMSRPSVISTTGADFEPGSSSDMTVQVMRKEWQKARCHKRTPRVAVIVTVLTMTATHGVLCHSSKNIADDIATERLHPEQ
jgi:hypothetical protein